jgi:hypothetical protein
MRSENIGQRPVRVQDKWLDAVTGIRPQAEMTVLIEMILLDDDDIFPQADRIYDKCMGECVSDKKIEAMVPGSAAS